MTTTPARGAPGPDQAVAAPVSHSRDRRGSPVPTVGLIATRIMELRKRRGLMITVIVVNIGLPAVFLVIRLLLHAFAPSTNPAAGGQNIFQVLVAGFLPTFGFITAATVGCTAGSRDLTEGTFRHLVVTGRSRLALYLARIPAGLAIVASLVAVGFTVVCAVCVFAAPTSVRDNGVGVPPGLSRAGFESWAANHAEDVVCDFPAAEPIPVNLTCATPPGWSVSSDAPSQPAPAAVKALAIKVAKDDYPGYVGIWLSPPDSLMIEAGLWLELEAAVAFVIGLGLASLMGQRTVPLILLIMFQMIASPILSSVDIPHLRDLQRSFVGLALAHLEPSALPLGFGIPGVAGGVARPGGPAGVSLLPESGAVAVLVVIAWLAVWTILGAWRMTTRDA